MRYENLLGGGVSGNLNFLWKSVARGDLKAVKIFLAGCGGRWDIVGEAMKIYLADRGKLREAYCQEPTKQQHPYILESFFYCDEDTERLLPYFGDFLLDSGAFTFMQGTSGAVDWNGYVERYADFIKRNKIEKFFELDIDSVVGYDKVKPIRRDLERLTGKQSIPVWHKSRGIEEYKRLCDEYPYVALGGIVSGEFTDSLIFVPVAFIGTMPARTLLTMIAIQPCLKVLYECVILPITSRVCKVLRRYEGNAST